MLKALKTPNCSSTAYNYICNTGKLVVHNELGTADQQVCAHMWGEGMENLFSREASVCVCKKQEKCILSGIGPYCLWLTKEGRVPCDPICSSAMLVTRKISRMCDSQVGTSGTKVTNKQANGCLPLYPSKVLYLEN